MKKRLLVKFRYCDYLLKVYEVSNGKCLYGVLYEFKCDTSVSPNRYTLTKVGSKVFEDGMDIDYVKRHFSMGFARVTKSDRMVDPNYRRIWTNDDYEEWKDYMLQDGEDEDTLTHERYHEDCSLFLDDERANLNKEIDGYIVAFADLGLWDGRHNAAKMVGTNVRDILYSSCDYIDWYCDRYNVRCSATHHDGTNHILYRVARTRDDAERLVNLIAYHDMDEESFRKATRSLRPYIAKVYGF